MTLLEMLIKAGYPETDIDHHESDLYIYDTSLTRAVLREYCTVNNWDNLAAQLDNLYINCFVIKSFRDNLTGCMMFDCAGQYYKIEVV